MGKGEEEDPPTNHLGRWEVDEGLGNPLGYMCGWVREHGATPLTRHTRMLMSGVGCPAVALLAHCCCWAAWSKNTCGIPFGWPKCFRPSVVTDLRPLGAHPG